MGWSQCDLHVLQDLLETRTHEVTVVNDCDWGTVGFATPRNEGEIVDPNQVYIDALASGHVTDPVAGGHHARTPAELSLDGMVAAFVTGSRLATGREQVSLMDGDLPPLPMATGPTLQERFEARNGGMTAPVTEPPGGYPHMSRITDGVDGRRPSRVVTDDQPALAGPAADLPEVPRLAEVQPPSAVSDPNRAVTPCGDCVFAGGLLELAQGNAVVTPLEGKACVRFVEGDGGDRRISGVATVALPASSRNWSHQDVAEYAIGKVLDGTRHCSDEERGNVSVTKGWFGLLGTDVACSGLMRAHPGSNRLVPKVGIIDATDPIK